MGPQRSLTSVAAALQKDRSLIARWSGTYRWSARARAFDAYTEQLERDAMIAVARNVAAKMQVSPMTVQRILAASGTKAKK